MSRTERGTFDRGINLCRSDIRMTEHAVPSKVNVLGAKGVGESGCTASLPTLANAMMDALRPLGVPELDMPFTPSKVWHAIQAAKHTKVN